VSWTTFYLQGFAASAVLRLLILIIGWRTYRGYFAKSPATAVPLYALGTAVWPFVLPLQVIELFILAAQRLRADDPDV
jgi:hypothetical protein